MVSLRSWNVSQGTTNGEMASDAEGEMAAVVAARNAKRHTRIRQFALTKRLFREHPGFIEDDRPEITGDLDPIRIE